MVPFSRNNTCPRQRVDGNTLRDKKGEEATKSRKHWKIRKRGERERERARLVIPYCLERMAREEESVQFHGMH